MSEIAIFEEVPSNDSENDENVENQLPNDRRKRRRWVFFFAGSQTLTTTKYFETNLQNQIDIVWRIRNSTESFGDWRESAGERWRSNLHNLPRRVSIFWWTSNCLSQVSHEIVLNFKQRHALSYFFFQMWTCLWRILYSPVAHWAERLSRLSNESKRSWHSTDLPPTSSCS